MRSRVSRRLCRLPAWSAARHSALSPMGHVRAIRGGNMVGFFPMRLSTDRKSQGEKRCTAVTCRGHPSGLFPSRPALLRESRFMSAQRSARRRKPAVSAWTDAAVLVSLAVVGCDVGVSPPPEPEPVTIAGTRSATGSLTVEGMNMARGIELAVKMLNDAGGIDGRQVRIILLDDESNPGRLRTNTGSWRRRTRSTIWSAPMGVRSRAPWCRWPTRRAARSSPRRPPHLPSGADRDGAGVSRC